MSRPLTKIIKKFLDGTCSDEEFAYLMHWYESFDKAPGPAMSEEEKGLSRDKMLAEIRRRNPELSRYRSTASTQMTRPGRWWKYAAAAVFIALLAGAVLFYPRDRVSAGSNKEVAIKTPVVLENQSNRVHQLVLPDGSLVWLSPKSKIEYPEKFFNGERRVRLSGEAFFDIAGDPAHPFEVMSGKLVSKVLGTSFLLSAYRHSPVEVMVVTGKVEVHSENQEKDRITLNKNQRAVLGLDGSLVKLPDIGDEKPIPWHKANLSFDDVPLTEVIAELNKKFGVHIYCKDKAIEQYRLNADFADQNLTAILEMLERSLDVNYEMENDTLINLFANKY